MSIVKRIMKLDLKSPFKPTDPRHIVLAETIILKQKEIDRLTEQFQKPLRVAKEEQQEAIKELTAGKDEEVSCTIFINHNKNVVKTQRNDTLEWLPERELNDEDREPIAFDEEDK